MHRPVNPLIGWQLSRALAFIEENCLSQEINLVVETRRLEIAHGTTIVCFLQARKHTPPNTAKTPHVHLRKHGIKSNWSLEMRLDTPAQLGI